MRGNWDLLKAGIGSMLAALLCSCGGGGGGNEGASIEVVGPTRIEVEAYEGEYITPPNIHLRFHGNPASLNGRTLILVAEIDNFSLFNRVSVGSWGDGTNGNLVLESTTIVPDGPQTYTGSIRVRACLDQQCRSEIPVAKPVVPYTVTVRRGLTFGVQSVDFATTFGTMVAPRTVPITLPAGTLNWYVAELSGIYNFGGMTIRADKAANGSDGIVVTVNRLLRPGQTATTNIRVVAVLPGNREIRRVLTATMSTQANGTVMAFEQPRADFVVRYGTNHASDIQYAGAMFTDGSSSNLTYLGITYGPGNFLPSGWLFAGPGFTTPYLVPVEPRVQVCYDGNCLPVGRYEATIHYRYAPPNAIPTDIAYPVSVVVTP